MEEPLVHQGDDTLFAAGVLRETEEPLVHQGDDTLFAAGVLRETEEPLVHQGDDPIFAAAHSIDAADGGADDSDLLISIAAIDEKYADELQLQEILVSSFLSTTPHIHTNSNVHHDEPPETHDQSGIFSIDLNHDQSRVVYIDPKGKAVVESESPCNDEPQQADDQSTVVYIDPKGKAVVVSESPCNDESQQADDQSTVVYIDPKGKAVVVSESPCNGEPQQADDQSMVVYIDPKGKAVVGSESPCNVHHEESQQVDNPSRFVYVDPNNILIVETPSSSRDHSKTANCGICMEDKPVSDFFEIGECKHEFCEECVGQYVAVKVEDNVAGIGCPYAGCGVRMEMEMCRWILRPEVFEMWGMKMCELMVEQRFYCPYNDCSAMMMVDNDGGEVIRASECPHCNRLFCAQCRVAWHGEIECSEFQALGEGEREREDLLLRNVAKDCKWQRCPKCGYYVERIDGCMFIKCRCGHGFCYNCASPMGDDHYCACLR